MYRPLVLRSARPAIYPGAFRLPILTSRKLGTTSPSSQGQSGTGQTPSVHSEGSNTLIILSALGALGGLYYYYTRGQPAVDREAARLKEEEMERKMKEAGKSKMERVGKQGQREYDEVKATVQDAATAARTRATEARTDMTERARQGAHEAQVKLDELKNATERKMSEVRDRSDEKIEEVARQAHEAENKTRGWFGWGSSK